MSIALALVSIFLFLSSAWATFTGHPLAFLAFLSYLGFRYSVYRFFVDFIPLSIGRDIRGFKVFIPAGNIFLRSLIAFFTSALSFALCFCLFSVTGWNPKFLGMSLPQLAALAALLSAVFEPRVDVFSRENGNHLPDRHESDGSR